MLARQLRIPLHHIGASCPLYWDAGGEADEALDRQARPCALNPEMRTPGPAGEALNPKQCSSARLTGRQALCAIDTTITRLKAYNLINMKMSPKPAPERQSPGPTLQVEQLYNRMLDEADRHRLDMGDVTNSISLRTALECVWDGFDGKTGARPGGAGARCSGRALEHTVLCLWISGQGL